MDVSLNDSKVFFDIIKSVATVIAIIAGGIWTYFLFIRNRLDYPKALIEIEPKEVLLPNNKRLIHTRVNVKNVGKVMLRIAKAELRLRTVVPLPKDIEETVNEGYDPVSEGETEIPWPVLSARKWVWKERGLEIEPEEDDTLHADYIIDESISIVEFYFYIDNPRKKRLGWTSTLIFELKMTEE